MMHPFGKSLLIATALLPAAASAQNQQSQATTTAPLSAGAAHSLDTLFQDLRRERDPQKAGRIAARLHAALNASGSATADLLMSWGDSAAGDGRNAAALDFLDRATLLQPDAAAVWARRANLHRAFGDNRKAMADLAEALKREPRHLDAISSTAEILGENGRDAQALTAWERYLELYPADRKAQETVQRLSEKLAGSRT